MAPAAQETMIRKPYLGTFILSSGAELLLTGEDHGNWPELTYDKESLADAYRFTDKVAGGRVTSARDGDGPWYVSWVKFVSLVLSSEEKAVVGDWMMEKLQA